MENSCHLADSIKIGPWGGPGGDQHWSFKAKVAITKIIISHRFVVDSISFAGIDENGKIEYSEKNGGDASNTDKVLLDWPREFLTSISGTCHTQEGNWVVQSLTFLTNRTKYGPFGFTTGSPFNLSMEGGVITGFHGRGYSSIGYVDAIGVFVKPFQDLFCESTQGLLSTHKVNEVMNIDVPREAGPWGGKTGKPFDDGVFSSIEQVNIYVQNEVVRGIEFLYKTKDGNLVKSKRHGTGTGGGDDDDQKIYRIKLDCSKEYIVGVTGYYGSFVGNDGNEALRCITFFSNKGKYGPFGNEIGTAFSSPISNGKVVGFHGRSGHYLCALGVHMEYF